MSEDETEPNDPATVAVAVGLDAGMSAVQSARVYMGWTREGLAIRAGVTVDEIYRAEEGQTPDGVLLAALAAMKMRFSLDVDC